MDHFAVEGEADRVAHLVIARHIDGGHDDDHIPALGIHVEMDRRAHHLGHIHRGFDARVADVRMLGTHAEGNGLALHVIFEKPRFLFGGQFGPEAADLHEVFAAFADEFRVEEIHDRHTDEAGDEQVRRMVEHLLRRTDLLDIAVLHDDDPVAQRHGLGLVVRDVDEGGVDALSELDDLGTHLVAKFCVQIGKRFVHQHDFRCADDRAADGDTLPLTAGQRLGLALQILRNVQDLRRFPDLAVDLVLGHVAEFQGECHVVVHGHMRIQGVALEDHGDVAILGRYVIDALSVDDKIAVGDLFKTCHHSERRGLAAARRTDEHDEFLVLNVQAEFLYGDNAFVRDLQIELLFRLVVLLSGLLLFPADVGIDLFPVFFGSALNNFGVKELLDCFIQIAPTPIGRDTVERHIEPTEEKFTGFVFKIHANMDPNHRDRIAFVRVVSGRFERNKNYFHVRQRRELKFANPTAFMAQKKSVLDEAYPGDIVGLYDAGNFKIGDTLTEGEILNYKGIPSFSPEQFRYVENADPMKAKQLAKGLEQLTDEGVAQLFTGKMTGRKIIGTVGELQFEVIQYRLLHEYNASCRYQPISLYKTAWITSSNEEQLKDFKNRKALNLAEDKDGRDVFLAESPYALQIAMEKYPDIEFHFTSEF